MKRVGTARRIPGQTDWWPGLLVQCPRCRSILELEAGDGTQDATNTLHFRCLPPEEGGCGSALLLSRQPDLLLERSRAGTPLFAFTGADSERDPAAGV